MKTNRWTCCASPPYRLREKINARGEALGVSNLADRIADETVGMTQEEILPFLKDKKHPALEMESMI